jgi:hypothetical protein
MTKTGARMLRGVAEGARVTQRQSSLTALAWDHRLCRAVLAVFARGVLGFERRRAQRSGVRGGVGGAVTAIQRFGSALNTNIHFHMLAAQGVFFEKGDGTYGFASAPGPTDLEVARLLAAIRRRIIRLVKRHGVDLEQPSDKQHVTDERLFECPVYAEI